MQFRTKYWLFQIIGWGLFFIFSTYVAILLDEHSSSLLFFNLSICVIGIVLTHFYRAYIIKYQWFKLVFEKLLMRIILSVVVLTLLFSLFYFALYFFFFKGNPILLDLDRILGAMSSIFVLLLIWNALYFFWIQVENSRKAIIEKLRMESDIKDLELRTMKASIQPHFIFNALNSIRALVDENPELARTAITQMSNILRNNISTTKPTDTLAAEMKVVDDYMALEKIRFEDRLRYNTTIDPTLNTVLIPTMMLQTLVENAVKHGISKLEQGGEVSVEAFKQNDSMLIQIKNSGRLNHERHPQSTGFGLNASRKRLEHTYGKDATINIIDSDTQVIVTINIPIKNIAP